jgi:hypothetical protein
LTEHYRDAIRGARIVACPGCYPTGVLLALLPLVQAKVATTEDLIIDAKSGVSGAGRTLKQNILFSEAGEGVSPYGIGSHRHVPEIEQELARAAGSAVTVSFTPHLTPMSRGELCTSYVRLAGKLTADDARQALAEAQHLHERTGVVGFDIAGPERGNPPRVFRSAYEVARLGRLGLTAHAGEDGPVEYVWEAVDELGVDRIGHGCAAARDPELLRRLARDRIAVEVCLSSNYHTGAVRREERHPVHAFLEAGVPVALCCDNSTVSRTNGLEESLLAASLLGASAVEEIHRAAEAHSFIRPETSLARGGGHRA